MKEKLKQNYGWVIVAYGILAMIVLHYGCFGSQAIFLLPITQDLGVTTTTLTLASTYAVFIHFFWTPLTGKIINRKSIRILIAIGAFGTGLSMVLTGLITNVYQYYAIYLFREIISVFALMLPFATLTARWFGKENRSFATSMVFVGISLGGVLLSKPLTSLVETIGWRLSYQMYGLVGMLVIAPLALLIVRDYPDNYQEILAEEAPAEKAAKIDFISLLKNKQFLLLCLGMSGISFVGCSLYHMSSYVQSVGFSAQTGATVISLYNFVCIFSKMTMGKLFDKKGMKAGILFGAVGLLVSYSLMTVSLFVPNLALIMVMAVFYGIGNTCQSITAPSMVAGIFGVANYSEVYAKMSTITLVVSAVSTPIISFFYESSGSYLIPWLMCIGFSVISTAGLMAAAINKEKAA